MTKEEYLEALERYNKAVTAEQNHVPNPRYWPAAVSAVEAYKSGCTASFTRGSVN